MNSINAAYQPKSGSSLFLGAEISGLGGTVQTLRPIVQYKHFFPMQKGRNTVGVNFQGSYITGYGGVVAPPFERFYLGGEYDLRGFDVRSISPVAFLPSSSSIALRNPDGSIVPRDPSPNGGQRGAWTIPIPAEQIVFPGGDTSLFTNVEYRVTVAGPVVLAPFMDLGVNPILRKGQLRINSGQLQDLNNTRYGCPALDFGFSCVGFKNIEFPEILNPVGSTNWKPRMSTGLELQVLLPVLNAPFRIYYAYNPLRLNTIATAPVPITRDMFPDTAAGDYTFNLATGSFTPRFQIREPRTTFRFSVATTF